MARAPKAAAGNLAPASILPLPPLVIAHHEATLLQPMQEWVLQKRVPPVLLMTGLSGIGKREIGYYLAQWILCERSGIAEDSGLGGLFGEISPPASAPPTGNPHPCGECAACLRALHGTWVDFTEIRAEEEEGASGALKIDQFRNLKSAMGFGAHEGTYRIILIPNADRMTPQAANSLLKLLEEPPKGWIFFLTASDPTLVLPTVLSRCQNLRLKPFAAPKIEALLREAGVPAAKAVITSSLAEGSWRKALSLSAEEVWEKRSMIFEFLVEPVRALNPLIDWASQDPFHLDLLMNQLEQLTSELIKMSISGLSPELYPWVNSDGKKELLLHVEKTLKKKGDLLHAREFWLSRAVRIAEARREALTPVNKKLLIQDLLIPWLELA